MAKKIWKIALICGIAFVVLVFLLRFYIVLDPGERAVIFNKAGGGLRLTEGVGFYLLIPLIESPTVYDVKIKTYTMSSATLEGEVKGDDSLRALTSDGQTVSLDLSVRFHPDPEQLIQLHQEIGEDYLNKVVRPQIRSIARLVVSESPVVDVYSGKRGEIQERIAGRLRATLSKDYIKLDDVLLRDVQFTEEFQKAIENKQIAQQEAQRMKYILEKEELEKKRKIIEAEGEAESIRLKGQALSDHPTLIQYEYVKLLSPQIQAIVTDSDTIINLSDFLKKKDKKQP